MVRFNTLALTKMKGRSMYSKKAAQQGHTGGCAWIFCQETEGAGESKNHSLLGGFFGKGMTEKDNILEFASWNNSDGLWRTGPGFIYQILGTQLI